MSRASFQVLVIPFRIDADGRIRYLLFRRFDNGDWQWIAGGGVDRETPEQAAYRETLEEAHIAITRKLIRLDSVASIPAVHFADHKFWGNDVFVVSEYCFGVEIEAEEVRLSGEHSEYVWLDYEKARRFLKWDSNKTALWELHSRLTGEFAELEN